MKKKCVGDTSDITTSLPPALEVGVKCGCGILQIGAPTVFMSEVLLTLSTWVGA